MLNLQEEKRNESIRIAKRLLTNQGCISLLSAILVFFLLLSVYLLKIKPIIDFENNNVSIKCRVVYNYFVYEKTYTVNVIMKIIRISFLQEISQVDDNIFLKIDCIDYSCVSKIQEKYIINSIVEIWSNDGILYENKPETNIDNYLKLIDLLIGFFVFFIVLYLLFLFNYVVRIY